MVDKAARLQTDTPSDTPQPASPAKRPRWWRTGRFLFTLAALLTLCLVWGYYRYYPDKLGPAQPISFSHRVHVTDKQISCYMCHGGAMDTPHSGVPPVETCMLCHSRIIVKNPQIVKLRGYWDSKQPVPWAKVNQLPEHVFFNHEVHVRAGFDCGRCHGNVSQMDRVYLWQDFQMGFCVQCHKDNNFSHDCYTCHR